MFKVFNNLKFQIIFILVLTSIVYANTLNNEIVWDDATFMNWEATRSFKNMGYFLRGGLPEAHLGDYRPLKGIILTLDYKLFKLNPIGYHIQAILIHLSATFLVFLVTFELFKVVVGERWSKFTSFLSALLFGIHPIQTEAITFITSSTDILGVSFFLASLYFYIRASREVELRSILIITSLVFAFFAFFTYPITLILPIVLILYDFIFNHDLKSRISGIYYLFYFALVLFYFILKFLLLSELGEKNFPAHNFYFTLLAMAKVLLKYISLIILPLQQSINHEIRNGISALTYVDYNENAILAQKITDFYFIISASIISALIIFAIFIRKRFPVITFCIFFFFIALLPVSNIIPLNNLMYERYLYLASYGWCLLASYSVYLILANWGRHLIVRSLVLLLVVSIVSFYSVKTYMRNRDWNDQETFWSKALKDSPSSVLANTNLGNLRYTSGDFDEAISLYKTAYDNNSRKNALVPYNLGLTYTKVDNWDEAKGFFEKTIEYKPDYYEAYYQLGVYHKVGGDIEKAEEFFKKAVEINPDYSKGNIELGVIYTRRGELDEAEKYFKSAKNADPSLGITYKNLAAIYAKQGKIDLAIKVLREALKINPDDNEAKELMNKLLSLLKKR